MATFEYNALTSGGRLMRGTIEAGSRGEAGELLEQMQLKVNSIEKAKPRKPRTAVGRNEFLLFNQQLASITKAGIPLERGLRELSGDIGSKSMRKLVDAIADELEAGVSIEEAFEKRQKRFPPLYGRILKAGVETGRLSEMLTSLNRHLEMTNQTRRIIFEALSYPAVLLAFISVIITAVFVFIIPHLASNITEMSEGMELPLLTRLFLNMAKNIVLFWIIVGCFVAAVVVVFVILSSFPAGRRFKESILFKFPVLGKLYHSSVLSKMAEAMAMMVGAGCDMPTCFRLGAAAASSEKLLLESEMLASQIGQGGNILEASQTCKVIPRLFLYSIQLGTQRNELQDNLYSLGQMYAGQVRYRQARLQAVLLPIMIVVVGGFVAMAVLAMLSPVIRLVMNISAFG